MLLNLDELRKQNFTDKSFEFFENWKGHYRFHDQSALNFLLHGQIDELPEDWNRAAWRFDQQNDNRLDCILHYTRRAPWLGGTRGPAQVLFERFAAELDFPVNRETPAFKKSQRQQFFRNVFAPFRALAFSVVSFFYKIAGQKEKYAGYQKAARYWFDYIRNTPRRRRLHHRRAQQIQRMKFKFAVCKTAT
jgi:lipopolysaccharide biosynthesis glycosyltransferase